MDQGPVYARRVAVGVWICLGLILCGLWLWLG